MGVSQRVRCAAAPASPAARGAAGPQKVPRPLPLLRFLLLVALAFGAVTACWLAPSVSAGRDTLFFADGLRGGSLARRLQGIFPDGHDQTSDQLIDRLKSTFSAKQAPVPAPAAAPAPIASSTRPAAAAPVAVPAGSVAQQPALVPPSDAVALAAAKALGASQQGINIVSSSPYSLVNSILLVGGTYRKASSSTGSLG